MRVLSHKPSEVILICATFLMLLSVLILPVRLGVQVEDPSDAEYISRMQKVREENTKIEATWLEERKSAYVEATTRFMNAVAAQRKDYAEWIQKQKQVITVGQEMDWLKAHSLLNYADESLPLDYDGNKDTGGWYINVRVWNNRYAEQNPVPDKKPVPSPPLKWRTTEATKYFLLGELPTGSTLNISRLAIEWLVICAAATCAILALRPDQKTIAALLLFVACSQQSMATDGYIRMSLPESSATGTRTYQTILHTVSYLREV